jgi:nucleolar protein 56
MDEEGWKLLQAVCKDKTPDIQELAAQVAPNTTALLGAEKAAELLSAAGNLLALSRMTQRDCQALGNESGQFSNKNKKSILENHEFATSDRALRILSSRTVLAARIDANNGEFKGDRLRQEVLYAQ